MNLYTIVAGWKEERGNDKLSKKGDARFGRLDNLKNRIKALLLRQRTRTFPAYKQVKAKILLNLAKIILR
jgi:hypothetical protein